MEFGDAEKLILDTIDIPSLSPVALRVLQLARQPGTSVNELERIISSDHAFAARILKIANSPYYGARSIGTITAALNLIGFTTMSALVIGAATRDLYRKSDPFESALWEHSLGVSIAASLLAEATGKAKPEEALIAGLLHDVGKAVLNQSIARAYAEVTAMAREGAYSFNEAEIAVLGYDHGAVGGVVARSWRLPVSLEVAVEHHHARRLPEAAAAAQRDLCALVVVADMLCLRLGIGIKGTPGCSTMSPESLGISAGQMAEVVGRLERLYREQRAQLLE